MSTNTNSLQTEQPNSGNLAASQKNTGLQQNQSSSAQQVFKNQPPSVGQQQKSPKLAVIVLVILAALVLIAVFIIFGAPIQEKTSLETALPTTIEEKTQNLDLEQAENSENLDKEVRQEPAADKTKSFPELGLLMTVADDWTQETDNLAVQARDAEISLNLSKGDYSLIIIKNPIYTGGGTGYAYAGTRMDEIAFKYESIQTAGETYEKNTQYLTSLPIELSEGVPQDQKNLKNIFGNTLISNPGIGEDTFPNVEVTVDGEKRVYLIKYEHASRTYADANTIVYNYVSIDDPAFKNMMAEMDDMVESIVFD